MGRVCRWVGVTGERVGCVSGVFIVWMGVGGVEADTMSFLGPVLNIVGEEPDAESRLL